MSLFPQQLVMDVCKSRGEYRFSKSEKADCVYFYITLPFTEHFVQRQFHCSLQIFIMLLFFLFLRNAYSPALKHVQ